MKGYENQAVKNLPVHEREEMLTLASNQPSVPKGEQGPYPSHPE